MFFLGGKKLEEYVTIRLVSMCFGVFMIASAIFSYFATRFQTKEEAKRLEEDIKDRIKRVETDVTGLKTSLERIGENVSYIRGRLEPNSNQGVS